MKLTYKQRIFPSFCQEEVIRNLAERCRLIYNFALDDRIKDYETKKDIPKNERERYISVYDQQKQFTIIKQKYPEYGWLYVDTAQNVYYKLDDNYKSFFALTKVDPAARPPRFRGQKYVMTMSFTVHRPYVNSKTGNIGTIGGSATVKDDEITFKHNYPDPVLLTFKLSKDLPGSPLLAEIFFENKKRNGKWFISVVCEVTTPPFVDNNRYIAIDPGISNIVSAVDTDVRFLQVKNKQFEKYFRKKVDEVKSKRDKCKKFSKRWRYLNEKVVRLTARQFAKVKDFQHFIAKKLTIGIAGKKPVTGCNTLFVGDASPKRMAKKGKTKAEKTLNYGLQNTGSMSRFIGYLTYKAALVGKRVIDIDEKNTTSDCPACGTRQKKELSERSLKCDCGLEMDRDIASAVNIMKRGLSQQPPGTGVGFSEKWEAYTAQKPSRKSTQPYGIDRYL